MGVLGRSPNFGNWRHLGSRVAIAAITGMIAYPYLDTITSSAPVRCSDSRMVVAGADRTGLRLHMPGWRSWLTHLLLTPKPLALSGVSAFTRVPSRGARSLPGLRPLDRTRMGHSGSNCTYQGALRTRRCLIPAA